MNISLRTEYTIRTLLELAKHKTDKPVNIAYICKKRNLPRKFIEQLFNKLKNKGIIKSIRGKYGGYILNKDPQDITLREIIEAVDDSFFTIFCSTRPKYCEAPDCDSQSLWIKINEDMKRYFDKITLKNVMEEKGFPYDKELF